jgi:hypothetical protein
MKQDIENIIRTNLPENKLFNGDDEVEYICECEGFNQALSQINTSLIADEVLKVVVEKIEGLYKEEKNVNEFMKPSKYNEALDDVIKLLNNFNK